MISSKFDSQQPIRSIKDSFDDVRVNLWIFLLNECGQVSNIVSYCLVSPMIPCIRGTFRMSSIFYKTT